MPAIPKHARASSYVAIAILSALLSAAAHAEDLKCEVKQSFGGGAAKGASLQLKTEGRKVVHLDVETFITTGVKGAARSCSITSSDRDMRVEWSADGSDTILTLTDKASDKQSVLRVSPLANGYKVQFEQAWSGHCGFGAEFPESISIMRGRKVCAVVE